MPFNLLEKNYVSWEKKKIAEKGGPVVYISGLERFIHFQRSAGSLGSSSAIVGLITFARLALVTSLSVDLRFLPFVRSGIGADSEETLACWALGVKETISNEGDRVRGFDMNCTESRTDLLQERHRN